MNIFFQKFAKKQTKLLVIFQKFEKLLYNKNRIIEITKF